MDDLPNIAERWLKNKTEKRKQFPQNNFWASNLGHPCDRFHFYCRNNWQDRAIHDPILQSIFDEGNLHEKDVLRTLEDLGFDVVESQVGARIAQPHIKQGTISMRIDGKIKWKDQKIPFDVKSTNPYTFQRVNSAEDLMFSKKEYERRYVAQLQMYMLSHDSEIGLLLFKNKLTGELKEVWCQIDYAFCETLLKRAERVEAAIQAEAPPMRINDLDLCTSCPFSKTTCMPDLKRDGGLTLIDDSELELLLVDREENEAAYKKFKEADKRIKELITEPGERLCGDFLIRSKQYDRKTKVALTWDEKVTQYVRTQIMRLEDE